MAHPDDFLGMKSGNDWGRGVDIAGSEAEMNPKQTVDKENGLVFPMDLQNETFYPEAISFEIFERAGYSFEKMWNCVKGIGSDLKEQYTTVQSLQNQLAKNKQDQEAIGFFENKKDQLVSLLDKDKTKLQKLRQSQSALQGQLDKNNKPLPQFVGETAGKLINVVRDGSKDFQKQVENPKARRVQTIKLQMPESVIFNEQVDWTGTDLGLVGALKEGAAAGPAIAASAAGLSGRAFGGALGALANVIPGVSGPATIVLGSVLGGESGIAGGIESTFNFKANPYKEQTFQGLPFRPFEFTFIFRPRSAEEASITKQIISEFRAYAKPKYKEGTTASIFKYPHEFRIKFLQLHNGKYIENKNMPAIKYCICKGINVNYTPQGWRTLPNSSPVDIQLTLSFEETEVITQEDVQGATKHGDFAHLEDKLQF